MQSWIRDLIDLKTQISVLQNCMHAASQQPCSASHPLQGCRQCEPWTGGTPRLVTHVYVCFNQYQVTTRKLHGTNIRVFFYYIIRYIKKLYHIIILCSHLMSTTSNIGSCSTNNINS
jgi:hypothetical protein